MRNFYYRQVHEEKLELICYEQATKNFCLIGILDKKNSLHAVEDWYFSNVFVKMAIEKGLARNSFAPTCSASRIVS